MRWRKYEDSKKSIMNIYVGNLPYKATDEELHDMFQSFGDVVSARIITDHETGRSKGFGFVEMSDDEQAKAAIEELNGIEFLGRPLTVNEARPRQPRAPRREFNNDRY